MESPQDDLDTLYAWQEQNNMAFSSKKFEVLRYGRNQELNKSTLYLTPGAENVIERKECLRDLGIQMSEDAKFSTHIELVCSKVCQKCGLILQTFNSILYEIHV